MLEVKNILVIAAHPDDEVLGCGATMARFVAEGAKVSILLLGEGPLSRMGDADSKARRDKKNHAMESAKNAAKALGVQKLITAGVDGFQGFPDNRFDSVTLIDMVQFIEKVAGDIKPDAVFTHHGGDLNIDHRVVHEAVMTAFRPLPGSLVKLVAGFEVLSSTEYGAPHILPPFVPTLHVDVTEFMEKKHEALRAYASEMRDFPHPRSYEAVAHLAALRGAQNGVHTAESFMCYRYTV